MNNRHPLVVHDIKDRKFWKQITTDGIIGPATLKLFTTSKIENFESKSQQPGSSCAISLGCSRHQRSKILKANHNINPKITPEKAVVHDIKDRKFWKQITTNDGEHDWILRLFTTSKIENFESKSQLAVNYFLSNFSCSRHQRSKILKANRN